MIKCFSDFKVVKKSIETRWNVKNNTTESFKHMFGYATCLKWIEHLVNAASRVESMMFIVNRLYKSEVPFHTWLYGSNTKIWNIHTWNTVIGVVRHWYYYRNFKQCLTQQIIFVGFSISHLSDLILRLFFKWIDSKAGPSVLDKTCIINSDIRLTWRCSNTPKGYFPRC